jgi:hypothetical protein
MIRKLCMTNEKWFASGESNVFRLSDGRLLSAKDF